MNRIDKIISLFLLPYCLPPHTRPCTHARTGQGVQEDKKSRVSLLPRHAARKSARGNGSSLAKGLPDAGGNGHAHRHSLFPLSGFSRLGRARAVGAPQGPIRPESRHVGQTCAPCGRPWGRNAEVT